MRKPSGLKVWTRRAALTSMLAVAAAAYAGKGADAGRPFFFKDGDRVVFLGDSITEQRLYSNYIETYVLTRYPQWKITFRNAGWGGDTSWLRQRTPTDENALFAADPATQQAMVEKAVAAGLGRDVLPLKPTAVTVKFGMNDHAYQAFREDIFRAYVRSQAELVKTLKANGARVALLTPQPIEERRPDPDKDDRNVSLRKFADGLAAVATTQQVTYADMFDPYMGVMKAARAADPSAFIGGGDAVHPGPAGQTIMAWAVLKNLGAGPTVSSAELHNGWRIVRGTVGCKITNAKRAPDGSLAFDRLDDALPWPIAPGAEPALKRVPLLDDLNRFELKVTNLKESRYELTRWQTRRLIRQG